ncbi:hypothetical protein [Ottowia sp. VDI28]|uniref:hypothetical protein n=1 Tax=Ottowia sp. VDI28 TaxID=3133968 RepID=UPI003C2F70DA
MNEDIRHLTEALQYNLELVRSLSDRLEMLEGNVEENAAQRMAVMLLLRAVMLSSPDRDQIAALAERMAAQMQAQPGILVDGGKSTFQRMKGHLDWMLGADKAPGG